nr:type II toxin-antitoxin system RelE/ParE family toxin [uncultured Actinoplanes sp.]
MNRTLPELAKRLGSGVPGRVLFVFDPWSQAVLLVAGHKAGDGSRWYRAAIPIAEAAVEAWPAEERKRRDDS